MPLPLSVIPPAPRENEPARAVNESAETLALLAQRRSCKIAELAAPGPREDEVQALLTLAARVPDHGKLGPWRFVVISGEARVRAGADVAAAVAEDADAGRTAWTQAMFTRAPTCVMVVSSPVASPKVPEWEQLMSAGAVCYGLLIAAHALGYGGCWLTEWPAFDARVRRKLGLAEHERIAGFVYLGTPRSGAVERVRADATSRIRAY